MLPETLAWTVLERHCTSLRDAQWVGHDFYHRANWADLAPDHVDLVVVPKIGRDTAVHPRDLGAALRLALAVARAVSCCRGFDTATHPRFWRRAVESLWRESIQFDHGIPPPENASALSSTAFTHIGRRRVLAGLLPRHTRVRRDTLLRAGDSESVLGCWVTIHGAASGVTVALPYVWEEPRPVRRLAHAISCRISTGCRSRGSANNPARGARCQKEAPILEQRVQSVDHAPRPRVRVSSRR
jgi:hypothetical protein